MLHKLKQKFINSISRNISAETSRHHHLLSLYEKLFPSFRFSVSIISIILLVFLSLSKPFCSHASLSTEKSFLSLSEEKPVLGR